MRIAIVPAYFEEANIAAVVRALLPHVDEVVVVDDASTDGTAERAYEAGATVLRHEINRGQGAALETGHAYARNAHASEVIHFDGDGQFSVADIAAARAVQQATGADIVFGTRFLGGVSTSVPWKKRLFILPFGRLVDRLSGGLTLTDSHNGFRLLQPSALHIIRITQDRMAHATEIPMLVKRHGLRYAEVPVTITYHEFGQGVRGGFRILRDLLLHRFL